MTAAPTPVEACCALIYGHPLVELIAGHSLHPGGLDSTRRLLQAAALPRGARLLDAGCGLGASSRLAVQEFDLRVDACDVSGPAVRRAAVLATGAGQAIEFAEASLADLPYPDGRFAGVLAECVLSTMPKRVALAEVRRVLAPDGLLLLSDVTSTGETHAPELLSQVLCLSGAWQAGELEDMTAAAGFRIVDTWDETASLLSLLDRLEARIAVLSKVGREIGIPEGILQGVPAGSFIPDPDWVGRAFDDLRPRTKDGRLGYRAVLARRVGRPEWGPHATVGV